MGGEFREISGERLGDFRHPVDAFAIPEGKAGETVPLGLVLPFDPFRQGGSWLSLDRLVSRFQGGGPWSNLEDHGHTFVRRFILSEPVHPQSVWER